MKKFGFSTTVCLWSVLSIAVLTPWANASDSKQVTVHKSFGSSRINNWTVIDRDTVIFDVWGYGELVAEIFPGCGNLRFARSLAIRDRAFELSRGSTLILPDGERCSIKSLTKLDEADSN